MSELGNPLDLLTAYDFFICLWTAPNQLSFQLILNLKVLTQHCSSLVVHMFEISIKMTCIFSGLDPVVALCKRFGGALSYAEHAKILRPFYAKML